MWIQVQRTVLFIVYTFLFIYKILIETNFCLFCIRCCYPVDRSFHFTSCKSCSAFCLWIISSVNNCHISIFICLITCTGHKICIHKTYFIAWEETEIFLRRLDHKIVTLNVKLFAEWNLSLSKFRILQVIICFQIFHLSFRIIVDHKFNWI